MPRSIKHRKKKYNTPVFDWRHSWQSGVLVGVLVTLSALFVGAGIVDQQARQTNTRTDQEVVVLGERRVIATAYSSTPDQTDDTPCHTADQFDLCHNNIENVIANNGLPFGTLVRFPDLYGDRLFAVRDRMNSRYGPERIDFWFRSRERAVAFGVKTLRMEIVEYAKE